jgi:hypothetical protein
MFSVGNHADIASEGHSETSDGFRLTLVDACETIWETRKRWHSSEVRSRTRPLRSRTHRFKLQQVAPLRAGSVSFGVTPSGPLPSWPLSVPTVSRATQMIISLVGSLPLRHYTTQWTGEKYEKIYLETESWMDTPDPTLTRNFIMSNTCMDLMMRGRAFWYVTSRSSATGRPLSFQWMPCEMVDSLDQPGPQFFGKSNQITFNGIEIPTADVIQFLAPVQGFLWTGRRVLETAIKLDRSAERFASNEIVAGYLQQTDSSEPLDAESLGELAAAWSNARRVNAVGALNSAVKYEQFDTDPSKMQLVEARNFSALELSRAIGVPAYLLGIGISGYNYSNATSSQAGSLSAGSEALHGLPSKRRSVRNRHPSA